MAARIALFCVTFFSFVPITSTSTSWAEGNHPLTSLIILFDGLALDDLRDRRFPYLVEFANRSHVGLMSTPVKGRQTPASALVSLASGTVSEADPTDDEAYMAGEVVEGDLASVVWLRRTGADPGTRLEPGNAVHLGIAALVRRGLTDLLPGCGHIKLGVAGNADTAVPGRRAALFAIDFRGIAENAWIDRTCLLPDADSPYGVRDDPDRLLAWADRTGGDVILHLGDGARAESIRASVRPQAYLKARESALHELNRLIGLQLDRRSVRITLIGVCPPACPAGAWTRLAPIVLGGNYGGPGLITSATTRTDGIIENIDVLPTLFGSRGASIQTGHRIRFLPGGREESPVERLTATEQLVHVNAVSMFPFFRVLAVLAAALLFGGLAAAHGMPRLSPIFGLGVLVLMSMPIALMIVPLTRPSTLIMLTTTALGVMLFLGTVVHILARRFHRLIGHSMECGKSRLNLMLTLIIVMIVIDTLCGQPLIKFSLFSSYQLQGLRFYGLGNEYMSVLIGAALVWAYLNGLSGWKAAAFFFVITLLTGLPPLGANAGGLIAASVAFGCGWAGLSGRRIGIRTAALWTIVGVTAAVVVALADRAISGLEGSHMGGAMSGAANAGPAYLADIVLRKLLMNIRILANSITITALLGVTVLGIWLVRLPTQTQQMLAYHTGWTRAALPVAWGSLAAFLFNDSGIVAAIFMGGGWIVCGLYLLFADAGQDMPVRTA